MEKFAEYILKSLITDTSLELVFDILSDIDQADFESALMKIYPDAVLGKKV